MKLATIVLSAVYYYYLVTVTGTPLPFVVIGLGTVLDEYGIKDITGKYTV